MAFSYIGMRNILTVTSIELLIRKINYLQIRKHLLVINQNLLQSTKEVKLCIYLQPFALLTQKLQLLTSCSIHPPYIRSTFHQLNRVNPL